MLGFDFLIDNQDRCLLLEVNHTPSFSADTPLDHIIKKNLLKDTLMMVAPREEEINIKEKLEKVGTDFDYYIMDGFDFWGGDL